MKVRELPAGREVDEAVLAELNADFTYGCTRPRRFSTQVTHAYWALQQYLDGLQGNTHFSLTRTFLPLGQGVIYRAEVSTSVPRNEPHQDWTFVAWGEAKSEALAICRLILHIRDDDDVVAGPITVLEIDPASVRYSAIEYSGDSWKEFESAMDAYAHRIGFLPY